MRYTPAVDLWASGVILFVLLGGYPPFYDESEPALFALIRKGEYRFDDPVWNTISDRYSLCHGNTWQPFGDKQQYAPMGIR